MGDLRHTVRQLDILRTLQARRYGARTAELATLYATTERTIQRDLSDLREAGFVLESRRQRDGCTYHCLVTQDLPPVNFPLYEMAGLLFVESLASALEGTPFLDVLRRTVQRIVSVVPESQAQFLRRAAEAYAPHIRGRKPLTDQAGTIIERLNQAILQQRRCTVTYQSLESAPKTYPIEPLRLLYYMEAGGLYLVARVPEYQQPITLAVERIQQLQPSDQRFSIRTDMAATVEERLRHAFGIIAGEPFQVQIRFSPQQAPYIRERIWHPSQQIHDEPDGGLVIGFHASSRYEIRAWILQHGSAAQVIAPVWLRQEVQDELRTALAAYEADGSDR